MKGSLLSGGSERTISDEPNSMEKAVIPITGKTCATFGVGYQYFRLHEGDRTVDQDGIKWEGF